MYLTSWAGYLDTGPGFNPGADEIFRTSSLLYNGYRVFPGGKVRPERAAVLSPSSNPEQNRSISLAIWTTPGLA